MTPETVYLAAQLHLVFDLRLPHILPLTLKQMADMQQNNLFLHKSQGMGL